MRVVLNNLTALRQKTGIGHYVTELVRSLRAQDKTDQFITFPGTVVGTAAAAWRMLGKNLAWLKKKRGANANNAAAASRGARLSARARLVFLALSDVLGGSRVRPLSRAQLCAVSLRPPHRRYRA